MPDLTGLTLFINSFATSAAASLMTCLTWSADNLFTPCLINDCTFFSAKSLIFFPITPFVNANFFIAESPILFLTVSTNFCV